MELMVVIWKYAYAKNSLNYTKNWSLRINILRVKFILENLKHGFVLFWLWFYLKIQLLGLRDESKVKGPILLMQSTKVTVSVHMLDCPQTPVIPVSGDLVSVTGLGLYTNIHTPTYPYT